MSGELSAEVVIVGGGIEGLSAAYALTARGVRDVLVLERETLASGGTAKSSGIVRCHYGVPSLAAMAWKGTQLLANAVDILGDEVGFHNTGYIVGVGPNNVEPLKANVAMQAALGIDVSLITPDEAAALWPTADLDDFALFAHEPLGGYGDAYQTAMAFAGAATRGGAKTRQNSPVTELVVTDGRVTGVKLAGGQEVSAGTVVLAAGPWSVALLAPLGIDLPMVVHREPIVLVEPGQDLGQVPVFSDLVSLQYVRTEKSGELLLGNSDLSVIEPADPDSYRNSADEAAIETAIDKFLHRFPKLDAAGLSSTYAGCYDCTPDFNPVISLVDVPGLVVAAGFSGHGYKIAPAVGDLIADLVTTGDSTDPSVPAADFELSRFAAGRFTSSAHPYVGAGQLR